LIANNVQGVSEGFQKSLEIVGTGYRAMAKGSAFELALGLSHPVVVDPPAGVTCRSKARTRLLSAELISRPSVRWLLTSANFVSLSHIRAREFATRVNTFAARLERLVPNVAKS
jgi:hypothetical protein